MDGQQNERMRGEAEAKGGELAKERLSFLKINRASLLASEATERRNGLEGQEACGKKLPFVKGERGILRLPRIQRN